MNAYQKLGLGIIGLIAFTQVLPVKAATLTDPYPVTMGLSPSQAPKTNQLPDLAGLLSDCGPNGTQPGTPKDPSNPPGDNGGGDPTQQVPEPGTMAAVSLAAAVGAWWKKKTASAT